MTPKFRLRRWLFGKHRRSPIIQILARQCEKNLSHFNNEDRNHHRNGEWWLQRALVNFYLSQQNRLTVFDVGANNGIWALNLLKMGTSIDLHCFEPSEKTYEELVMKNICRMSPVGIAWERALKQAPNIKLYREEPEGSFPTVHGTYLTAACLFVTTGPSHIKLLPFQNSACVSNPPFMLL